jgi:receptor-type tyrosine-protein phosphatase F
VWWEAVPVRSQVIGYEVFYSMAAVEDLDQWERKTVGLVTSIDLVNLERHAQVCVGDLVSRPMKYRYTLCVDQ